MPNLGGTAGIAATAPTACPADLDGDGSLGVSDLMLLLEGYGTQFQVSHLLEFTAVFGDACE